MFLIFSVFILLVFLVIKNIKNAKLYGSENYVESNEGIEIKQRMLKHPREQWLKDLNNANAKCVWETYTRSLYRNLNNDEVPLVLYGKFNDLPSFLYQRHEFGKSWNEILKDPQCVDYIIQELRDNSADEKFVKSIYKWAMNGQIPNMFPLEIDVLFFSDYPRDIYIYRYL